MLRSLRISNYALIESAEWNPGEGLNVITGETGAGKSILLGALGLIRGERADRSVLYDASKKCVVEGVFELEKSVFQPFFESHDLDFYKETWLRRELSESGRSRAFINDSPVTLDVLKALTQNLIDIHGQRDTAIGLSDAFKFQFFSIPELSDYLPLYNEYRAIQGRLTQLEAGLEESLRERDFFQFQWAELSELQLVDGELESLQAELESLEYGENIQRFLAEWSELLERESIGLIDLLGQLRMGSQQLSQKVESMRPFADRISAMLEELKDLDFELQRQYAGSDFDPDSLEKKSERMHQLQQAMQKHRVSDIAGLIDLRDRYHSKISNSNNLQEQIDDLQKHQSKQFDQLLQLGASISQKRLLQKEEIEAHVSGELQRLGMEHAQFQIALTPAGRPNPWGTDEVELLFSANLGSALQPVEKVASGGEFSRLMLVLKAYLAYNHRLPTLIFDEIDTGVSGKIASKVGAMLHKMGESMQLVAITHLPQVASKGQRHFKVFKSVHQKKTITQIQQLNHEQRVEEVAGMLGGAEVSEASYRNAKELLGY